MPEYPIKPTPTKLNTGVMEKITIETVRAGLSACRDGSIEEFLEDYIEFLEKCYRGYDTHCMNPAEQMLIAEKGMIKVIVESLKNTVGGYNE